MNSIKLAVLPGDGIGQEVTAAALPIFEALAIPVDLKFGEIGWECWRREGNTVPQQTWDLIQASDATLLGAITSQPVREAVQALPRHLQDCPPEYISPVIQLRQQLDLYANIRPCFQITGSEFFNFCVIRENTEGLYAGLDFYPVSHQLKSVINENPRWKTISNHELSCSLRLQSLQGLTRLFEFSFTYANALNFSRVTFADKPNVLRKSSAFARKIFESIAEKYPHIEADILNVDAVALWMIKRPQEFGVIVAENMFGDILSDLGAGIMGGLGFAPSANMGDKGAYFEPVHGSGPRVKSNTANPSAMFLTIALLLEKFGYHQASDRIKNSIRSVIRENKYVTYDLNGKASTAEMAQAVIEYSLSEKKHYAVSFLSTGNELIEGEVQNTNSTYFAKILNKHGADIYQHIQTSDKRVEIIAGIKYLLGHSDIVIVTGGLGPTSDDCTRFAVSAIAKKNLVFDQNTWDRIARRLKRFNLKITDENKQQALFPQGSSILVNNSGTANGCYFELQGKYIFMLPGPPRECRVMFDEKVVPFLQKLNIFNSKITYRWLTMGLIEGEIAKTIDRIIYGKNVHVAYRWHYPFIEIKLTAQQVDANILDKVNQLLKPNLVTTTEQDISDILVESFNAFNKTIHLRNDMNLVEPTYFAQHGDKLCILSKINSSINYTFYLHFYTQELPNASKEFNGAITFCCHAYHLENTIFKKVLTIPNRGPEIKESAKAFINWQLNEYLIKIRDHNESY